VKVTFNGEDNCWACDAGVKVCMCRWVR